MHTTSTPGKTTESAAHVLRRCRGAQHFDGKHMMSAQDFSSFS